MDQGFMKASKFNPGGIKCAQLIGQLRNLLADLAQEVEVYGRTIKELLYVNQHRRALAAAEGFLTC